MTDVKRKRPKKLDDQSLDKVAAGGTHILYQDVVIPSSGAATENRQGVGVLKSTDSGRTRT